MDGAMTGVPLLLLEQQLFIDDEQGRSAGQPGPKEERVADDPAVEDNGAK